MSPQCMDANKNSTDVDVKKKSYSSNQTLDHSAITAPAKQRASKKVTPTDDKENVCKGKAAQAAASTPAKERFLSEKTFAPRCNDHTQKGIIEFQSTGAHCNQVSASRQCHSSTQELLRQTIDFEPAESGSVITLAESPTTATAPFSSLGCLRNRRHAEEQWTPVASTISNSSAVNVSILLNTSSNSHDTSVSAWNKQKIVTPCNLFEKNVEDILDPVAETPEKMPTIDPLVRSLSTDFMACKEVNLGNENSGAADYSLSASKKPSIQVDLPTGKRDTSILCLNCGGTLLTALHRGTLQKLTLKKKFLSKLLDSMNSCRECQPAGHTDVLVCEMQLLHSLVEAGNPNTQNLNQPSQSVWVEEDGCVFKPLFCPWCKYEHCIGAFVPAADRTNTNLVDMALLLCDALSTTEGGEKCIQEAQCWETGVFEGRYYTQSLNSLTKRASQTQTPPRPKLKLPRRD